LDEYKTWKERLDRSQYIKNLPFLGQDKDKKMLPLHQEYVARLPDNKYNQNTQQEMGANKYHTGLQEV
jgi:hypothetical protein